MKTVSTLAAAALAVVLQGAFASVHAVNASGHCTGMTTIDYVSSDADTETNSMAWQNITDGHLTFTTSAAGCVAITFSGTGFLSPSQGLGFDFLDIRTLLDGKSLCMPAAYIPLFLSAQYPGVGSAGSVTHICKNVAAGAHTVQVQLRSDNGQGVGVQSTSLTVTHN